MNYFSFSSRSKANSILLSIESLVSILLDLYSKKLNPKFESIRLTHILLIFYIQMVVQKMAVFLVWILLLVMPISIHMVVGSSLNVVRTLTVLMVNHIDIILILFEQGVVDSRHVQHRSVSWYKSS